MSRSEASKANKKKYDANYRAEHYKRIPLDVTFEKYEQIKSAADSKQETVNGYIKKAIDQRLNQED